MNFSNLTIGEILHNAKLAISNALSDPDIMEAVLIIKFRL